MHHIRRTLTLVAAALVLAACGQRYRAKQLVDDFMEQNMTEEPSGVSYSKLDSTRYLTPQAVGAMRRAVGSIPSYRSGIGYPEGALPACVYYIKVSYDLPGASGQKQRHSQTFYFDREASRVIAFKDN